MFEQIKMLREAQKNDKRTPMASKSANEFARFMKDGRRAIGHQILLRQPRTRLHHQDAGQVIP